MSLWLASSSCRGHPTPTPGARSFQCCPPSSIQRNETLSHFETGLLVALRFWCVVRFVLWGVELGEEVRSGGQEAEGSGSLASE